MDSRAVAADRPEAFSKGVTMIEGVRVVPLKRIPDERGTIFHMLKCMDAHFRQFGEIYFTTIYPGVIKGWHKHREMTLNYACIEGRIKLVLYDDRANSPTRNELMEVFWGPDNYALVVIAPEVWNGMKGMSAPHATVATCATHPHDPSMTTRLDLFSGKTSDKWGTKHCSAGFRGKVFREEAAKELT